MIYVIKIQKGKIFIKTQTVLLFLVVLWLFSFCYYISIYTNKIPTNERAIKVLAELIKVCRNLRVGSCKLQEMLAKCCLYVEGEVISDTINFCAIQTPPIQHIFGFYLCTYLLHSLG